MAAVDLTEMILSALAKYLETFEQLRADVDRWQAKAGGSVTPQEVGAELERLIAAGHVQAYELSTELPYEKKAPYAAERRGELWYRATTQGLEALARLEQGAPKPWWPE
jgi:hypothetical protein